ncbi:MAG: hypothetical protein ACM3SU_10340 [Acidobacteriota bacterium]
MSGLEKEFPGKVEAENLDATTEENKKIVKSLGFETHGLVIRSSDGQVLWKQRDHEVKMDEVRAELKRRLGG